MGTDGRIDGGRGAMAIADQNEPNNPTDQRPQPTVPRVSVIVPVYNGAATIAGTVRSILAQTFRDFEVLVIDDGSTDGSGAIAQAVAAELGDERLRVLTQTNGGQAIARNHGMAIARGEFFAFIDADDWWTPDKLAAQVAALDAHPAAALAYSWTVLVNGDRQPLGGRVEAPFSGAVHGLLLVTDFISSGSNPLVRRSAIARVGGFDPALVPSEDWDLWLRIAAEFEVICVPEPHILYRQRPASSSDDVWRQERVSRIILNRELGREPGRDRDRLWPHRRLILANRYKYLLFKALDAPPTPRRGWTALRFLGIILWGDRGLLRQGHHVLILLLRIALTALLPGPVAHGAIARFPPLTRIHTFPLNHTKIPRLAPQPTP
jgi:glycosyltransferase involved in cell wall biosynthesis